MRAVYVWHSLNKIFENFSAKFAQLFFNYVNLTISYCASKHDFPVSWSISIFIVAGLASIFVITSKIVNGTFMMLAVFEQEVWLSIMLQDRGTPIPTRNPFKISMDFLLLFKQMSKSLISWTISLFLKIWNFIWKKKLLSESLCDHKNYNSCLKRLHRRAWW